MRPIRTLIVDDERLARQRIRRLLSDQPGIEISGDCASVREAREVLSEVPVDLVFLDIEMPHEDGFQLLQSTAERGSPLVIFVTAHEQYALPAFGVSAVDYLLKPVDEARFRLSLSRSRELLRSRIAREQPGPGVVLVRSGEKTLFLKLDLIDWIEAEGNYVRLHVGSQSHLLRETLNAFDAKLDGSRFTRIHRSAIVNLERIVEFQQWFNGDLQVILQDGQQLRMSRTYRNRVQDLLGKTL